ncbi:MAG: cell division protein SepF [Fusobacterium sp.]|nr:cell division protein SepF [Fusobacterium sp.]
MAIENADIIFVKPEKFEDCVKCAGYIKADKIVTINLSQLDDKDSRRVLDYITGAIYITGAEIVNVGNKIFCSIPKGKEYLNDSQKENSYNEEEEIIPTFKR